MRYRRKVGRTSLTWMKLIEKDLASVNVDNSPEHTINKLIELTEDRSAWKFLIKDIIAVS